MTNFTFFEMGQHKTPADLLLDRQLMENIHQLKEWFLDLFAKVGSEISLEELKKLNPKSKGVRITKGNELGKCPYQVLDLIRDFDLESGFNIRVLNWWGHGLFLLILMTKKNPGPDKLQDFQQNLSGMGYKKAVSDSPWDYSQIINEKAIIPIGNCQENFETNSHLQLIKKLSYPNNFEALQNQLIKEIRKILIFYGN